MAGYIGSKAVNLSTTGADINGDANIDGDLSFRDNDKAIFGAGSDLQIYHSGSHSVIKDAGDGNLQLIANDFQLRNGADNANMMTGANGGAVTLMHNGSSKLATTSTGIDVTGTVTADDAGFYQSSGTSQLRVGASSAYNWNISRDNDSTGGLQIQSKDAGADVTRALFSLNGDISFYEDTGTTAKFFWDASAESLGIGVSDPDSGLEVQSSASGLNSVHLSNTSSTGYGAKFVGGGNTSTRYIADFRDYSGASKLRLDGDGNVGIGTSSPSTKLELASNDATNSGLTNLLTLTHTTTGTAGDGIGTRIVFNAEDDAGSGVSTMGYIDTLFTDVSDGAEKSAFAFSTRNGGSIAERMRIDSSGNVGIGNSNPSAFNSLGASDKLVIGDSTDSNLTLFGTTYGSLAFADSDASSSTAQYAGLIQYYHADNSMQFYTGSTERMRIDSSGNLLVGKTAESGSTAGHFFSSTGYQRSTRNGGIQILNRITTDGSIIDFQKDGSAVGSIITSGGTTVYAGNTHGIMFNGASVVPSNNSGTRVDNTIDIGSSSFRYDDIYATNGTIQTSDRNEKQDIAELSDAEQRVAVAAKGLLRKFRWKDAVAEKGDEARTHFGIIAQDLQAAFAAEGLDAGDYAMFISSTWTDEETGEERTRMGVRYSELLAFIIGAL